MVNARSGVQLELIVTSLSSTPNRLGAPYFELRAFKTMLFTEDLSILSMKEVQEGGTISPLTAAYHLFSRLPPNVHQSPAKILDWQVRDFLLWSVKATREEHEAALLTCVQATLEACAAGKGRLLPEEKDRAQALCAQLKDFLQGPVFRGKGSPEGGSSGV